ncbi:MAG: bifunctional 5,10-methylenetetrahydrofolate dehydrogenase/5,10-methenyltetrahydrofolate cyclohydrolase [Candidatus Saccharimonadales bacterium]
MQKVPKTQKILGGTDLAAYIKQRQAGEVRALRQAHGIQPKLAIVMTGGNDVIDVYVRMKKKYGADILIDVDIHKIEQAAIPDLLKKLNDDASVQGIIIQLPLSDTSQTEQIVELVNPAKDVDALGSRATCEPATPMAILWLLAGYNVDLKDKQILLVGRGKLVGAPLERMMRASGLNVSVADRKTVDLQADCLAADVIITATGQPGIIKSDMLKSGAVVVDAGVASESGKTVGDLAEDVYLRNDITVTPLKGGVGPLTVCALFENVIRATRASQEVI